MIASASSLFSCYVTNSMAEDKAGEIATQGLSICQSCPDIDRNEFAVFVSLDLMVRAICVSFQRRSRDTSDRSVGQDIQQCMATEINRHLNKRNRYHPVM